MSHNTTAESCFAVYSGIGLLVVFAVFNVAVIFFLRHALKNMNIKEMVQEKNPPPKPGEASSLVSRTSFSRSVGATGIFVLLCLYWAVANIVIFWAFVDPAQIGTVVSGADTFFLAGLGLFAPYAVNQFRAAVQSLAPPSGPSGSQ